MNKIIHIFTFLICVFANPTASAQIESTQKVTASDRQSNVDYGYSVDVFDQLAVVGCKDDGTAVSIGHPHYDNGAAYIYTRAQNTAVWQQAAKVKASDPFKTDRFGYTVATDGETVAIGSPFIDTDTAGSNFQVNAGAVYIFEKTNGGWTEQQKLVPLDRSSSIEFGRSLSFRDGLLVIGANGQSLDANGQDTISEAGAAYVFEKNNNGRWVQTAKLVAPERQIEAGFGNSVATDGKTILVGTKNHDVVLPDSSIVEDAGQLVFFEKNLAGQWTVTSTYSPDFQIHKGNVGMNVGLSGDWAASLLTRDSAYTLDGTYAGKGTVGIFHKNQNGTWEFAQKMALPNFDTYIGTFGWDFDLAKEKLAVSSKWVTAITPDTTMEFAGTAHLFRLDTTLNEWYFDRALDDFPKKPHDFYGTAIATDGTHILVGSTHEDEDVNEQNTYANSGAAYFYGECVPIYTYVNYADCKTFEFGDSIYTQSTVIFDTIGCNNVRTIRVDIFGNETAELTNNSLKVRTSGALQWLDCADNYAPIQGANDTIFMPQQDGIYAAEVSYALGTWSCVDTTDCVPFMLSSTLQNADSQENIHIFPNPFSDFLQLKTVESNTVYQIFNAQGILQKSGNIIGRSAEILTSELSEGIYFLRLENSERNFYDTQFLVKHF